VSGNAAGVAQGFQTVLHWFNNAFQYWTTSRAAGEYTFPPMKPGTYTMKMYRNEFLVAQESVSVIAGSVTIKNIASAETNPSAIWRIGSFDGQPFEFKNGDKIERMHPSDVRMSPWGGSYTVGRSSPKDFPMALFAKQGGVATVTCELAANQAAAETVLRIGTTLSVTGGRPSVKINNWQGKDPGAPVCPVVLNHLTRGRLRVSDC
jgi:rhamnogalacturonan endolyase